MIRQLGKAFIKSTVWILIYILIQTFAGAGIFAYKINNDIEYAVSCADAIEPYLDENYAVINSRKLLEKFMEPISKITTPILFISGIITVIVILLYLNIKKQRIINSVTREEFFRYLAIGLSVNFILSFLLNALPPEMLGNHEASTNYILNSNIFIVLLSTGVISPFVEEFIFRYGVQKNFLHISPVFAIIYQALLFGSLHGNLIQISYAFLLGIIMGIIYYRTERLKTTILFHCSVNISSIISARFFSESIIVIGVMAVCTGAAALFLRYYGKLIKISSE